MEFLCLKENQKEKQHYKGGQGKLFKENKHIFLADDVESNQTQLALDLIFLI